MEKKMKELHEEDISNETSIQKIMEPESEVRESIVRKKVTVAKPKGGMSQKKNKEKDLD